MTNAEPAQRGRIGDRLRFDTLAKCGFRCHFCGVPVADAPLVVDHVVPACVEAEAVRIGRPALEAKRINVLMPPTERDKIDALVGTYGRAKFIREAVENELKRREK